MLALLKNKVTALPCRVCLGFFMPVNTLCFQNLRQEESRKSVLHALIERIQAYPDRKMEIKFRIGEKMKGQVENQTLPPMSQHTSYPLCSSCTSYEYISGHESA